MTESARAPTQHPELGFIHRFERGVSSDTVLLLHGTGGDENDLVALGHSLAPHASLLAPRGQVLEGGMPRFFRRLAIGVFDEADLAVRAADLAAFVRAGATSYSLDPTHIWALGYSNGANIAAALLLLQPDLLAGAVLLRAVLPIEPQRPPDLMGKGVLLAAGTADPYAPAVRVEALAERLTQCGAHVDVRWQQGGHALEPDELPAVAVWLARRLSRPAEVAADKAR
ncbi:MAG: alpha/beta hydrolase [Gemmatimonadaceae bacterium]